MSDFAALWEEHYPMARGLALKITRNPADADDVASEVFTSLYRRMAGGFMPDSFKAYLATTIRNRCADRRRSSRTRRRAEDRSAAQAVGRTTALRADRDPSYLQHEVDPVECAAVVATLAKVSPAHRRVLWHLAVEGRTPSEVADDYGVAPELVSAQAYRARIAFRHAWSDVA